jgi:hypothetical protein
LNYLGPPAALLPEHIFTAFTDLFSFVPLIYGKEMSQYPFYSSISREFIWLFNEPVSSSNYLASNEKERYQEGYG